VFLRDDVFVVMLLDAGVYLPGYPAIQSVANSPPAGLARQPRHDAEAIPSSRLAVDTDDHAPSHSLTSDNMRCRVASSKSPGYGGDCRRRLEC